MEKIIFKPKTKNYGFILTIALAFPFIVLYDLERDNMTYLSVFPLWIPFFICLWAYLTTKYAIDKKYLYYQSAFLKGKILIHHIKKIEKNKTLWVGTKPALATKGLIIYYNFDEIYMAPKDNEKMINALLQHNPNIIIQ